ncbi:MAG: hypothetical protein GF388_12205 [Candidatus Aegiribacteria sp.]|nr:hypothetical protein [Candidatus Aegiribacteria sp.]MBD3295715.1 hypothetical protein [Candidatus Fermentibacteria bacterium]
MTFLPGLGGMIEKRAVLHVHTRASDGTGTPEEVIAAASEAGVDILGINDHNNLDARNRGFGGWHGDVFVLAGAELEDAARKTHMLVYGIDELPGTPNTAEQIEFVNERSGVAIAAHPTERPGRLPKTRSYSWKAGSTEGLAGVEVWNYMSSWKEDISIFNMLNKIRMPDLYVEHPDHSAVEFWEKVEGCAIATPDAHALQFGFGRRKLEVFPYRMLFERLSTHILFEEELSGHDFEAEAQIINALREGCCFCSNMLLGDASGFRVRKDENKLHVRIPGKGRTLLYSGGEVFTDAVMEKGDHRLILPEVSPFSLTVMRKGRTWIHSGVL